jgi:FkbH-like protein
MAQKTWIVVAATFTGDPLRCPLEFWMSALETPAEVRMAPYGQLIQELLNPYGALAQNSSGYNVLLIRLEDWIRDRSAYGIGQNLEHVRRAACELATALEAFRARASAPTLVFFGPRSSLLAANVARQLDAIQADLVARFEMTQTHCLSHDELMRLYPVAGWEDPVADRAGHIPYTNEYFVAIATLLARRIAASTKPQYKVIAVDCDNTLWKGVCGEEGPMGVILSEGCLGLQRMLVRQHDAGMLLCLCSKNNSEDIAAVFRAHPDMPLREEHIVCARVNWCAKSVNLQSMATELGLSLDTCVFIDDSVLECAEVRAHCPSVLVLRFPETEAEIQRFLDHVWAFDARDVTDEARRRTSLYKEDRARRGAFERAPDLGAFLASLEIRVDTEVMRPEQLPRVAELIQRTNQFNTTGVRRSASELAALCASGELRALVVHVRDRYGDYGLVGALLVRLRDATLDVDTFVLSCRVLGRGVEHRIVNELAAFGRREACCTLTVRYRDTSRNAPAKAFLETAFGQFTVGQDAQRVFAVPLDYAQSLVRDVNSTAPPVGKVDSDRITRVAEANERNRWHETASRLTRIEDIAAEIARSAAPIRPVEAMHFTPRTPTEATVAKICADILGVDSVSTRADFFDLGGDSLLAVRVIARIAAECACELSVYELFDCRTIETIARKVDAAAAERTSDIRRQIDQLHDQAVLAEILELEKELQVAV